jgi:type I restriction enzyme S subunit
MTFTTCDAKYSDACMSSSLRLSAPMLNRFSTNPEPLSIVVGSKYPRASIGELSVKSTARVVKKGDLPQPAQLIDLENVSAWGAISEIIEVSSIGSNRLAFGDCDVLTSKLRPYLGKTIHNAFPDGIGTTEWVPLKVDPDLLRPRLLGYLLQSKHYVQMSSAFMAGKEHPRISPDDILSLQVPIPPLPEQDSLVKTLDALSSKCRALEEKIGSELDLVDAYFEKRFGLQVAVLDAEMRKQRRELRVAYVALNPDLRFSFKFHAPSVEYALKSLRSLPHRRVSDYLSEDIVLGSSVSPDDYDATSDKLYLSMATIKSWSFSRESANAVSEGYFAANAVKAVRFNDILMARSGEGTIGKVALVPIDVEGICADFTMRVRVDPNICLPEFARFYFMSKYFQHVVYGEKKGLGNNTNIFPSQLRELPFIEIPLVDQKVVVDEINALLGSHFKEKSQISSLRTKMEDVLTLGLTGKPYSHVVV